MYDTQQTSQCESFSLLPFVDCKLQAVSGPCEALIPRYYFDENKAKCLQFTYGGCGGNRNNFETQQDCALNCPSGK